MLEHKFFKLLVTQPFIPATFDLGAEGEGGRKLMVASVLFLTRGPAITLSLMPVKEALPSVSGLMPLFKLCSNLMSKLSAFMEYSLVL